MGTLDRRGPLDPMSRLDPMGTMDPMVNGHVAGSNAATHPGRPSSQVSTSERDIVPADPRHCSIDLLSREMNILQFVS